MRSLIVISWITLQGCAGIGAPEPVPDASSPRLASEGRVRFVAVGDTGLGNRHQHQVAKAMAATCAALGCDFGLLLGDNLYPHGLQEGDEPRMDEVVTNVYERVGIPFYGVLGNHDWGRGRDLAAAQRQIAWAQGSDVLVMPDRYYRFTAGEVDFFALDTTPIFWSTDRAQPTWLASALRGSDAPVRVVFGHHTFRSDGRHGNAGAYEGLGWAPIVRGERLRRLFERHVCPEADLYVSGHDHLLQHLRHCDTELVVSGSGASVRPAVDRGNQPIFVAETLGFAWIEIATGASTAGDEAVGRTLTIAFYDADGQQLHRETRPLVRARSGAEGARN